MLFDSNTCISEIHDVRPSLRWFYFRNMGLV